MAPRKQVKQAAAETTVALAAADGNVTPPKKSKTVKKSTVAAAPKQAKTAAPRQLRQVKEREAATVFSPKYLRSRNKDVVPKNDAGNEAKKVPINRQRKEKAVVEDNNVGEKVVKNKVQKKAPAVAKSAVKKAEENPPKKTRGGKMTVDEENVAPPAKVRSVKRPRKRNAQTEVAEPEEKKNAGDEPEVKKSAETIAASKEPREKAKKTGLDISKLIRRFSDFRFFSNAFLSHNF